MFCVYKFYYFNINNFFYLNSFNSLLLKNNIFLKNFSFFFLNVFKKNNKLFTKKKTNNYFLLNYVLYFNKVVILKNKISNFKELIFYKSYYKNNFYYFSHYNYIYIKKIINLLLEINKNNFNSIILDKSYKNVFPLYNYVFKQKNLLIYKKYFFINTKFFTYNNWHYYYSNFLKKFNIIFVFILDYFYFNKFFKLIKTLNLPLSSLVPINMLNTFIDYPMFIGLDYNFEKFVYFNFISQIILFSFNYKNYINKLNFIKLFYKFYKNL